jgi:hypothetical protein
MGISDGSSFRTAIGTGIILAVLTLGIVRGLSRSKDAALFLVLWLFIPFLVVLAISLRRNFYNHRYFIIALPAYLTIVSAGATYPSRRMVRAVCIVVVFLISVLSFSVYPQPGTFPQQDWKAVAAHIDQEAKPSDIVAASTILDVTSLRRYGLADLETITRRQGLVTVSKLPIGAIWRPDARLWIIETHLDDETERWLRANAAQVAEETRFPGLIVILIDPTRS